MNNWVVVDTDVSYMFKGDTRATPYRDALRWRGLLLTLQAFAELQYWATQRNWGPVRRRHLGEFLAQRFHIDTPDRQQAKWWARVRDAARRAGRPIAEGDAWQAAAALHYGLPLATHNPTDYAGVPGLQLITG